MKILPEMYTWTRKSSLNSDSHPDLYFDQGIFNEIFTIVANTYSTREDIFLLGII